MSATSAQTLFNPLSPEYRKWLREDVRWIITDAELREFRKLVTNDQRDKFVADFWARRNPTPGSKENSFKEGHYRRVAYANQHFEAGIPGSNTDRGRIYVIYGRPVYQGAFRRRKSA